MTFTYPFYNYYSVDIFEHLLQADPKQGNSVTKVNEMKTVV